MRGSAIRRRGGLALLALLAVLVTGCQARLSVDVTVDRDGAGTLAVTLAADAALRARARTAGVEPLAELAATGERLRESGWRVADRTHEDGSREVTLSASFDDPAQFNRLSADLTAALDAPEVTLLDDLRLEVTDDLLRLDGRAGLVPRPATADLGLAPDEAVALAEEQDLVAYDVTVALAGEVLETTADDEAATPLRWEIAPGEQARIHVLTQRPTSPWLLLVLAAGAGLTLAVLARGLPSRRRRRHIFR